MSMTKTWYTLEEAAAKFGLERAQILSWIEEGVVRTDETDQKQMRINIDDLDLKMQEMTGI